MGNMIKNCCTIYSSYVYELAIAPGSCDEVVKLSNVELCSTFASICVLVARSSWLEGTRRSLRPLLNRKSGKSAFLTRAAQGACWVWLVARRVRHKAREESRPTPQYIRG